MHQVNIMLAMQGICFAVAFFIIITKNLSKKRKLAIFLLELFSALLLTADRFAYLYRGNESQLGWWMVRISNFFVFLFSLTTLFSFNLYLKDLLTHEGSLEKVPVRLVICDIALIIGAILLIIAQFNGMYYTFDATNHYRRAKFMLLCYLAPSIVFTLDFSCIIQYYKRFSKTIRIPIVLFSTLPIVATIAQIFLYGLSLTNMTIVGMAILIYVFAIQEMNNAVERAHILEVELLEQYKIQLEKTSSGSMFKSRFFAFSFAI